MEENFKNIHLQLSADDISRIDSWKVSRGMKSRTEAIRAMIKVAYSFSLQNNSVDEVNGLVLAEKTNNNFLKPDFSDIISKKSKNSDELFENLVRKMVQEEVEKIINNKK
jgi:metal-responsive CopG/Arc/MetJ family transcriptional regulator